MLRMVRMSRGKLHVPPVCGNDAKWWILSHSAPEILKRDMAAVGGDHGKVWIEWYYIYT